jgi:hypothetical protein
MCNCPSCPIGAGRSKPSPIFSTHSKRKSQQRQYWQGYEPARHARSPACRPAIGARSRSDAETNGMFLPDVTPGFSPHSRRMRTPRVRSLPRSRSRRLHKDIREPRLHSPSTPNAVLNSKVSHLDVVTSAVGPEHTTQGEQKRYQGVGGCLYGATVACKQLYPKTPEIARCLQHFNHFEQEFPKRTVDL